MGPLDDAEDAPDDATWPSTFLMLRHLPSHQYLTHTGPDDPALLLTTTLTVLHFFRETLTVSTYYHSTSPICNVFLLSLSRSCWSLSR